MSEHNKEPNKIQQLALKAAMHFAYTITDIFNHLTVVSIIGIGAAAVGYALFFRWLSYQAYLELRRYLPAMLSVMGFMYAIYKAIPALEDFWGLKRSRVNTSHPLCVYAAIAMWLVFLNSIIFAFGFQLEAGVPFSVMFENFFGRYGNDTEHYIAIAQYWYRDIPGDHRLLIVFFPFYAILVRVMYFFSPSYMFAAVAVSNIFAFAGSVMFYKLAKLVVPENEARLGVKFLLIFPSAFFLLVPLTESLFLFFSIVVIYYVLKDKYLLVFTFGLLASLTRSAGMLLIIPVACEAIGQILTSYRAAIQDSAAPESRPPLLVRLRLGLSRKDFYKLANLLAFPLGVGIYLLINYTVYGNATEFMIIQREHWNQNMYYFWNTITYLSQDLFSDHTSWVIGVSLPGVVVFWLSLALIIYGANKIRPSLTLYALAYFIFAFGPTWLMSGPRYVMVLFPLAFTAAKLAGVKKGYNLGLTIAYLVMFAYYFHGFLRDNFVF